MQQHAVHMQTHGGAQQKKTPKRTHKHTHTYTHSHTHIPTHAQQQAKITHVCKLEFYDLHMNNNAL